MRSNENGFTLVEGLLSLSIAIIICVLLFPLLFKMLLHLHEGKKDMIANRLLYEHIEQHLPLVFSSEEIRTIRETQYDLSIAIYGDNHWRACVEYDGRKKCFE
ncbi:type II secretion system protein [Lederbergia panacisoli]|uniref:type II secretion system protein n=1 Tax=Lederbergia panacisoli TaxID=1255251 RepID=UPI00214BEE67|nr:type II secretion system protein [Lederbergia panacisoli]MCR2820382.1 type II secretion system GspH family protein [Lederbergia panacisoli]